MGERVTEGGRFRGIDELQVEMPPGERLLEHSLALPALAEVSEHTFDHL